MSDSNESGNAPVNDQRRKVVRNLLAGAGVTAGVGALASTEWMKPVINAVVLPAHAQMSVVAEAPEMTDGTAVAGCCQYYFDIGKQWCYDDGGSKTGDSGPVAGGFSVMPWTEPAGCPPPNPNT